MPSRLVIVAIALAAAVGLTFDQQQVGLDFYHLWGIQHARARAETALGSPYEGASDYARVLNAEVDALWLEHLDRARLNEVLADPRRLSPTLGQLAQSLPPDQGRELWGHSRLMTVNARRRSLDPTGTPLSYAVMGFLPSSYPSAMALWGWVQLVTFVLAGVALARALGRERIESWLFALIAALGFLPYRTDVQVGNVNGPHLLLAAAALAIAAGPLARREESQRRLAAAGVASLATLHALFKPTFPLLSLALFLHALVAGGKRARLAVIASAAGTAALVVGWTSLHFDSPGVWLEWLQYLTGDGDKLAYDLEKGNLSSPLRLAASLEGVPATMLACFFGFGLLAVALSQVVRPDRGGIAGLLRDPFALASLGIVIGLAASPLVWGHYFAVALIPIAWLGLGTRAKAVEVVALLVFVLVFSPLRDALPHFTSVRDPQLAWRALAGWMWVPLAVGMLVRLSREKRG